MVSEIRKATARANGAKSRGPKTEAGKRRSSQNSLKHGIYAGTPAVAEHVDSLMAALPSQTPFARLLVRIMAIAEQRRTRLDAWEAALLTAEIDRRIAAHPALDPATHASLAIMQLAPSGVLSLIHRYRGRFTRQIDDAREILLAEQAGVRFKVRHRANLLRLLLQHPETVETEERTKLPTPPETIETEERTKLPAAPLMRSVSVA